MRIDGKLCCSKGASTKDYIHGSRLRQPGWNFQDPHAVRQVGICQSETRHLALVALDYHRLSDRISSPIQDFHDPAFKVDYTDHNLLRSARHALLKEARVANPIKEAVIHAITSNELQQHWRRKMRHPEDIQTNVDRLITTFTGATDILDVTLFNEQMATIWNEQQKCVTCIVDHIYETPPLPLECWERKGTSQRQLVRHLTSVQAVAVLEVESSKKMLKNAKKLTAEKRICCNITVILLI